MNDPAPESPKTPCGGNCSCAAAPAAGGDSGATRRNVLKGIGATLGVDSGYWSHVFPGLTARGAAWLTRAVPRALAARVATGFAKPRHRT